MANFIRSIEGHSRGHPMSEHRTLTRFFCPPGRLLYHTASAECVESIKENGIVRGSTTGRSKRDLTAHSTVNPVAYLKPGVHNPRDRMDLRDNDTQIRRPVEIWDNPGHCGRIIMAPVFTKGKYVFSWDPYVAGAVQSMRMCQAPCLSILADSWTPPRRW